MPQASEGIFLYPQHSMQRITRIFSFKGEISGAGYLAWGVLLFLIKYPVDHLTATEIFGVSWSPLVYVSTLQNPLFSLQDGVANMDRAKLWLGMLGVALPFLYVGLALTVQRLRALSLPLGLAAFFFLPFLNLVFFAFLVVMRENPERDIKPDFKPGTLDRYIPMSKLGCVLMAIGLSVLGSMVCFGIASSVNNAFGSTVFVGIPYVIGYVTVVLIGYRFDIGLVESIGYACLSILVCFAAFLSFAIEGIICCLMASPIVLVIAALGAVTAYFTRSLIPLEGAGKASCVLILPILMVTDLKVSRPRTESHVVVSHAVIEADPMTVWDNVVTFPRIPKAMEQHWLLKFLRVPRLDQAIIEGEPPEAVRRCVFEEAEFVEPIEIFEPGKNLTFGVSGQPKKIDTFIQVRRGQFLLTRRPDGSTEVKGSTWLELTLYPHTFWRGWVDNIVHLIHLRAFEHIKNLSEAQMRTRTASTGQARARDSL